MSVRFTAICLPVGSMPDLAYGVFGGVGFNMLTFVSIARTKNILMLIFDAIEGFVSKCETLSATVAKGETVTADTLELNSISTEIDKIRRDLKGRGVFLRMGRDFNLLKQRIEEQPERHEMLSQFDPAGDMDGASDAFWICGHDADGELVHTQAAHLLNLKSGSVSDHIKATLPKYLPPISGLRRSSIRARQGPKAKQLVGRVVYHGEMWLRSDLRDKGTATLVNRLGMYQAVKLWDPDSIFGLMSWVSACKGFNMRIGYMHSEPMALLWDKEGGEKKQHQVWTVYMEREDINFLMDLPAVEFGDVLRRNFI